MGCTAGTVACDVTQNSAQIVQLNTYRQLQTKTTATYLDNSSFSEHSQILIDFKILSCSEQSFWCTLFWDTMFTCLFGWRVDLLCRGFVANMGSLVSRVVSCLPGWARGWTCICRWPTRRGRGYLWLMTTDLWVIYLCSQARSYLEFRWSQHWMYASAARGELRSASLTPSS